MKKILYLIIIAFAVISCNSGNSLSDYHEFSDLLWHKTEKPKFEFNIKKEGHYSINIDLRLIYGYTFRNIKINMNASKDATNKKVIPINFKVRNEDDSFKGEIMGDFIDLHETIITDTILSAGKYTFELDQTMDNKTLPFVMEVGVVLNEKTTEN